MRSSACCLDAAPMPNVKRPPRGVWAVRACCATSMGCRPYSGTTEVPNSVRCGASAPTQASATRGWTASAWETQRLSNPAAHSAAVHRLQQVLEDAHSKWASGATDGMGVSGRAILGAWLASVVSPEEVAERATGRLRKPKQDLHDVLEESLAAWEAPMETLGRACTAVLALLDPMPGLRQRIAQERSAAMGVELAWWPSAQPLCSGAKLSAGNQESAGQCKRGRTGTGTKWLRAVFVACAPAAGHPQGTYLGTTFRRFARRQGKQRAAVRVVPRLVEAAYCIIRDTVPERDFPEKHLTLWGRRVTIY
jgi:hypothetical protein